MARIGQRSGCKVGWITFDDETEAREFAATLGPSIRQALENGYDFGYQSPGSVEQGRTWPKKEDGTTDYTQPPTLLPEWTVCVP